MMSRQPACMLQVSTRCPKVVTPRNVVAQLVDNERSRVDRQRLAVAFRELALGEIGTLELHTDAIGDAVTRTLRDLRFAVNDRIGAVADQRSDVGILEKLERLPETPQEAKEEKGK